MPGFFARCVLAVMVAAQALGQATQPVVTAPTLAGKSFLSIPGEKWTLLFHEEFDGPALDASKWSHGLSWAGDDGSFRHHNPEYASYITDDNVTFSDGQLHLLTKKQDVANPRGTVYHYTQAFIQTDGKFSCTYGYIETRVKVPADAGPGLWPAFWMLSRGWPPEDDIAEFWTGRPLPHSHQGFAYRNRGRQVKWQSSHEDAILPGFHTWGMEWGPGYKIFNRDGIITVRAFGPHVPDVPMYLILNSGVAAKPGPSPATVFPNAFVVDYVRVYARPAEPAFHNGGFEGESRAPWTVSGDAAVVSNHARSGERALRLNGVKAAGEQTVYGLKPGTTCRASAWIDAPAGTEVRLEVKNFDGDIPTAQASTTPQGQGYREVSVQFTTGVSANSATVSFSQLTGNDPAFVDDVVVALP